MVVNTTTHTLARNVVDTTAAGENSRTGSYFDGKFYAREWSGAIQILEAVTGAKTNSTRTPFSAHTASDTDFGGGLRYTSGYAGAGTSFQVYDVAANTLTSLANQPSVPNHSTITAMR